MEDTKPKTFVFVLMPFSNEFADIYEVGIKQACKDAGAYCERVDEQTFDESILERVYNQISKADVIVAEMTGRNPNVFYETGYAHALNKRVILLTQDADDIPFDLKHYSHIVYEGKISTLKSQLEAKVRWCIANPKESLSNVEVMLEFFLDGTPLSTRPEFEISFDKRPGRGNPSLTRALAIHNVSNKPVTSKSFSLAFDMPVGAAFSGDPTSSKTVLHDGRTIYNLASIPPLFPGGWQSRYVSFYLPASESVLDAKLIMYTELGARDYSFTFRVKEEKEIPRRRILLEEDV
jgi:hypothetical protein